MLHGWPQDHHMWHAVAPDLVARGHRVVLTDLRGYGASDAPPAGERSAAYAKREMAADQLAVMDALGHDRFALVGHDRGARVGHRLALDHPERLDSLTVIDVVPTRHVLEVADLALARAYFHWFLLGAPAPVPENVLGADPVGWVRTVLGGRLAGGCEFHPEAEAAYLRAHERPEVLAGTIGDYRAALGIDQEHDRADAGRRVEVPVRVLWGADGFVGRHYDVLGVWREYAADVDGAALPGGHFVPEQSPAQVLTALLEPAGEHERGEQRDAEAALDHRDRDVAVVVVVLDPGTPVEPGQHTLRGRPGRRLPVGPEPRLCGEVVDLGGGRRRGGQGDQPPLVEDRDVVGAARCRQADRAVRLEHEQVERPGAQLAHALLGRDVAQHEVDARQRLAQPTHERDEHGLVEALERADGHGARGLAAEDREVPLGVRELGLDPLGRVGEDPAGGGEHGSAGLPVEDRRADLGLELRHLLADRRGGHAALVGGGEDAAEAVHGEQGGQSASVERHKRNLTLGCVSFNCA
ncbi:hypothetical protein LUZ63_020695 [Rhynchospora breviuscula]|uniref:AB hydrolase-1 domain-containing protein n=1 Tax=Rhynchospora breviuscula TaxID=2022672 RepID=A0A9P9Z9D0_9POAL|nr:hypothetical protein LUZ63_020695 [Rhynchospora breviuscula]